MMPTQPGTPQTTRARIVYFCWNNFPRLILLAMIVLIIFLFVSIKKEKNLIAADKAATIAQEKPPVNVVVLPLELTTITDRINLPGLTEPWTRLQLKSKLNGTITEVLVQEGDKVQKGNILARIEAKDYKIALNRAEAAYRLAKSDYERDKSIYDKGVIPTSAMDANKTKMQTAQADYDNARLLYSRTTVTSPMSGVIRRMDAKVGLQLSVGDPLAEILEIDRLKGVIGIPESDVTAVRKLDRVNITVQALNNREISAKIHFLSLSPETVARIYNLELEIDNSKEEIFAGMFIRADIIKETISNTLAVPFYSVISRNEEQFVYIEEDGAARKRVVQLGIMEKWSVQITEGLHPGDKLLVEGHRDVEDGQKVKIVHTITNLEELRL
ncbi:MAG: efflux RND transporter periplasmic adaptor subunit [Deltaproteobacteria bacterium]|nr:efflux RND transporter periplasmic adaptor subunit [Deltaproteobacteria bacterium]